MKKVYAVLMALMLLLLCAAACAEVDNPTLPDLKTVLSAPSLSIRTEVPVPENKESVWGFSPTIGGAETLIPAMAADLTYAGKVGIQFEQRTFLDELKKQIPDGERSIKNTVLILEPNYKELDLTKPELDLTKPELDLKDPE